MLRKVVYSARLFTGYWWCY